MQELVQLQKQMDAFTAKNIQLLAVTTDDVANLKKTSARIKSAFPVLHDEAGAFMDIFSLKDTNLNPSGKPVFRSGNFLVGADGKLVWQHYGDNYRVRLKPDEVLAQVDAALKAVP